MSADGFVDMPESTKAYIPQALAILPGGMRDPVSVYLMARQLEKAAKGESQSTTTQPHNEGKVS